MAKKKEKSAKPAIVLLVPSDIASKGDARSGARKGARFDNTSRTRPRRGR